MTILRSVLVPAALMAAIALPLGASAQQAAAPAAPPSTMGCDHQMSGHHGTNPMASLNLTPAQKTQIKQIRQQYMAAHPCGSQPDPAARKQMRAQIMNVLTPQQRQQLETEMGQQHPQY